MNDGPTVLEMALAVAAFLELRLSVGRIAVRVKRLEEGAPPPGLPVVKFGWRRFLAALVWMALGLSLVSCKSRGAAALGMPMTGKTEFRIVTLESQVAAIAGMLDWCMVASLAGMGIALAVAFWTRAFSPALARMSLAAAVGCAAVFGLACSTAIALPFLPWALAALFLAGIAAGAWELRRWHLRHGVPVSPPTLERPCTV